MLIESSEALEPGLSTFLSHVPVFAPGCNRVIETFVGGTDNELIAVLVRPIVKIVKLVQSHRVAIAYQIWHYPGKRAVGLGHREALVILEDKHWIALNIGTH